MRSLRAELEDNKRAAAAHALSAAQKLAEAQVWIWCPLLPMMVVESILCRLQGAIIPMVTAEACQVSSLATV